MLASSEPSTLRVLKPSPGLCSHRRCTPTISLPYIPSPSSFRTSFPLARLRPTRYLPRSCLYRLVSPSSLSPVAPTTARRNQPCAPWLGHCAPNFLHHPALKRSISV